MWIRVDCVWIVFHLNCAIMETMRLKILMIFLILSIGIIGIFGFLNLSLTEGGFCPISAMLGGDCPPIDNALALAVHHISGLQFLTQFTVNFNPILLILSVLLLGFLFLIFMRKPQVLAKFLSYQKYSLIKASDRVLRKRLLRWLAILNRLDPRTSFLGV